MHLRDFIKLTALWPCMCVTGSSYTGKYIYLAKTISSPKPDTFVEAMVGCSFRGCSTMESFFTHHPMFH